ncbi:ankyrin repeat domain-containing protein [Brachyspira alvinipulli]|uniref:ankyrin repeat domain-containing protein n=1 Tax=Brachyspira alvinipulli TaxID=84379 RepID=UPI0004840D26|nr:ankyrin repeat domain-containing protein [Brachyspira alvinipulli]
MENVFSLSLDEYEKHNRNEEYDSQYTSKLLEAVENDDLNMVIDIIHGDYNADVNAFYSNGTTPLIRAIENRNIDIVKELLSSKNIDIDILDNHKYKVSALSYCVFKKNLQMLKILVSNGARADKGERGKNENNTPFLIACWDGWLDGVKYFSSIKHLSLNHTDKNGFTGLIKAVIRDRLNIVDFLCSYGKNIDFYIRCYNGKNAMDYCKENMKNNNKNAKIIYNIIRKYYD